MTAKVNVDLDEFKRLHAKGFNDREIGEALGFSRNVSARTRNELNLAPNPKHPDKIAVDLEEFKRLYAEGKKDKEIAQALGFSFKTAWDIRNKIGLPPQKKLLRPSRIDKTEFLKYYQQGKNTKEIANDLHVDYKFLNNWMRRHKYKVNRTKNIQKPKTLPFQQQIERKKKHEERLELYNKGLLDEQIATELGEAKKVITRWRFKNKLLRPDNPSGMKVIETLNIGFSLPSALQGKFNEIIEKRGYSTYSEAVRDAIRNYISNYEQLDYIKGRHVGIVALIYNHTKHSLRDALIDIQHNYSHLVRFSVYTYIDQDSCLEIIVLDGDSEEIKKFDRAMKTCGKIEFSELTMVSLAK